MNFPQVAILWWDESKANSPYFFPEDVFCNPARPDICLINGQLIIVDGIHPDDSSAYNVDLLRDDRDSGFVADSSNLIFLGEL